MKIKTLSALVLMVGALFSNVGLLAGPCPEGHCSAVAAELNDECKRSGDSGKRIYYKLPDVGYCSCPCSCFAGGTTVSTQEGEIDFSEVVKNQKVPTPRGLSTVEDVKKSEVVNHPILALQLDNGETYRVSMNHAFVREGGVVTEASRLKVGDKLQGEGGSLFRVKGLKRIPAYTGPLYNLVLGGKDDSGEDKIYFSKGLASADWTIQSFRDRLDSEVELRKLITQAKKEKN